VGATHQDLHALIQEQRFREDLYYRLAEIVVNIPPLRARLGDAVLLGQAFLRRFAQDQRRGSLVFSEDALRAIERHTWPGNVRELLNSIKRASIMSEGIRVSSADLALPERAASAGEEAVSTASTLDLRQVREAAERQAVLAALARSDGSIVKAAELLCVSRPTLYDLMAKLAIKQHLKE
jgi:two-component system NtrC family response regulator